MDCSGGKINSFLNGDYRFLTGDLSLLRARLTMGRTPASFGKRRIYENPSFRCTRTSMASDCLETRCEEVNMGLGGRSRTAFIF